VTTTARRLAARVLLSCEAGRPTLGELLNAPDLEALPPRERALLHELVLGTLRTRGFLDHALRPLLTRPLERLEPPVRTALRLGAYQILSTRVPHHAAVSESVDLAEGERARGLVNAVLRRLTREGPPALADPVTDPEAWLTTAGSLPGWLAKRWLERLGPSRAVARAEALLRSPAAVFRLSPHVAEAERRLADAGVTWRPLPVPGALRLVEGRLTEASTAHLVSQQAESSQLAARLAANGAWILDACAAPGGKARLIADLVAGSAGRVVALEVAGRRLRALARLSSAWGATNLHCVAGDARQPPFRTDFDSVLLDAPCSGLGTIGRNPDIRWRLKPRALRRHARRQRALLPSVARVVRPGGRLVYAVCSLEPEETDDVVRDFLDAAPDFSYLEAPGWAQPYVDGPSLRCLPERDEGDGFFIAVLARRGPRPSRP
jgi:16S rRNA (cytosine967-C5)-methyltransferase